MRALQLTPAGLEFKRDYPQPRPAAGEVLVRVVRAGVCETDLQLMRGYMGFHGVLGHEFVGVAESGPLKGDRVVGEINCSCGECKFCRSGLRTHCPRRSVLGILNRDGAFADYLTLPAVNLHRVADELSTDEAVFTEPLAAAFQIPAQITLRKGDRAVVLGDGRLGNLCAQVIRQYGVGVKVIGKHAAKLALLDEMGIETQLLEDALPDRSAEIVVDCTGSPTGLPTALEFVKPRGVIVLKTTVAGAQTLALAPVVIDEITVVGSRCGPFPVALEALRTRQISVTPLIQARYSLDDAIAALEQARTAAVLKVLLDVGAPTGTSHTDVRTVCRG